MMKWIVVLFTLPLYGFLEPWYPPLFEINIDVWGKYRREGVFSIPHHELERKMGILSLDYRGSVTFMPYWNLYGTLLTTHVYKGSLLDVALLAKDRKIDFSYENFILGVRHLFLDELACDPVNLSLGLEIFFPQGRCIHHMSFLYHGYANMQGDITLGRTLFPPCDLKGWCAVGLGYANQGSGWLNMKAALETSLLWYTFKGFIAYDRGLGSKNMQEDAPFMGYRSIAYRVATLGGEIAKQYGGRISIALGGSYVFYAENYTQRASSLFFHMQIPLGI